MLKLCVLIRSILLRYLNAHPTLAPTYILSGPLKSTSQLAQTQLEPVGPSSPGATQSLAHLATQGVKIVDMDQMSDADRNSEPDEADEMGMKNDDGWPGNDEGAEDGLVGDGVEGVEREDEEVVNEEVPRWGMVLVQGDALEGELLTGTASTWSRHMADQKRENRLMVSKEGALRYSKLERTYLRAWTGTSQGECLT
jgi:DNA polymerase delta subunit 3